MSSYDDAVRAIQQIQLRGERPSVRSIRAEMGGGSHSTVAAFLKRWRAEQAQVDQQAPIAPELAALDALAPEVSQRLREAFRAQVAREVASLTDRLAAADHQVDEMGKLMGESEVAAAEARMALADHRSHADRQIAAVDAAAARTLSRVDAIGQAVETAQSAAAAAGERLQVSLELVREDQRVAAHQVLDVTTRTTAEVQAIRRQQDRLQEAVDAQFEATREHHTGATSVISSTIRTAMQDVRLLVTERIEQLHVAHEDRLARILATQERERAQHRQEMRQLKSLVAGLYRRIATP